MPHTFKAGDRAKGSYPYETIGYLVKPYEHGWLMMRDDKKSGSYNPYWFVETEMLLHDTDFQVGDWVRYEAVEPYRQRYEHNNGKTGQIVSFRGGEFPDLAIMSGELGQRLISNLVKIQPPQEQGMNPYAPEPESPHSDATDKQLREKIALLERQVEKAKHYLETYRDLRQFLQMAD